MNMNMNDVFYENENEMNLILFKRLKADDSQWSKE